MKNGHVIILDRYTRSVITANPTVLFAFGDNLARIGFGGQAAEARGCLNAVGIPTKVSPRDYIWDDEVRASPERYKGPLVQAFAILRRHLKHGGTIVWPKDGVGTGLARLAATAPTYLQAVEAMKDKVFSEAVSVIHQTLQSIEGNAK